MTADEVRAMMPRMPFNNLLGLKLTRLHKDGLTVECAVRPDLLNGAGVVHGGVTATMADAAVGIALNQRFGGKRPITTVELKINYFRPVAEGKVFARAYLVRVGSSICVGRADLRDARKNLIATALVTYMLLDGRSAR